MSRQPNAKRLQVNFRQNESDDRSGRTPRNICQPGKVKLLGFAMNAKMGAYADAVRWGITNGVTPDTSQVRQYRVRPGGGVNIEQQIMPNLGAFFKASMNDGKYEEYDFTEINQSITTGLSLKGAEWGREDDTIGLAFVVNEISSDARAYFAQGGQGGLIGDGSLASHGPESILETYYKFSFVQGVALTLDYQHVTNPAYNTGRGPIDFWGFRMHAEY